MSRQIGTNGLPQIRPSNFLSVFQIAFRARESNIFNRRFATISERLDMSQMDRPTVEDKRRTTIDTKLPLIDQFIPNLVRAKIVAQTKLLCAMVGRSDRSSQDFLSQHLSYIGKET